MTAASGRGRVLMVGLEPLIPGRASYAHMHGIGDGLADLGWDVRFVAPESQVPVLGRFLRPWATWRRLRALLDESDVVYVRDHPLGSGILRRLRRRGKPVVLEVNAIYSEITLSYPFLSRFLPLLKATSSRRIESAASVITVSDRLRAAIQQQCPHSSVEVIPNGVDVERFTPSLRGEGPFHVGTEAYVVYVGALAAWQGVDWMLEAAARDEWPREVSLVVAGSGSLEERVTEAARQESGNVVYLGQVEASVVPGLVASSMAALSIQTDVRGSGAHSPMKLLEGMASGVPVLVSDLPEVSWAAAESAGIAVSEGDSEGLARAVALLHSDVKLRDEMGATARRVVVDGHTWLVRAAQTDGVLSEVLERTGRRQG